jgi:hypothetical protein
MTTGNVITLVVFFGTVVVSLAIAHLHRKQMRQIELHRADPSAPLKPPPGVVAHFFARNALLLSWVPGEVIGVYFLVTDLKKAGPIDRSDVFVIALQTSLVVAIVIFAVITTALEGVSARLNRQLSRQSHRGEPGS